MGLALVQEAHLVELQIIRFQTNIFSNNSEVHTVISQELFSFHVSDASKLWLSVGLVVSTLLWLVKALREFLGIVADPAHVVADWS